MFGEQALIYKKKRAAHCIVVSDDCQLCVMNDQDFGSVFAPLQMQEEEKRKVFIEREILADPEMRSLTRVIGINFTKRRYVKSKVLFSEGERPEKLYFVYEGQILLWTDSLEQKDKDKKKLAHLQDEGEQKNLLLDFSPKKKQKYDIMLSGAGKMVGEEEIFTGQRRRYNAVVDCECLVYEIECERMLNVSNGNHFVRNILQQKILDKTRLVNTILEYKRLLESVTDNLALDNKSPSPPKKPSKAPKVVTTAVDIHAVLGETDRQLFQITPAAAKHAVSYLSDCIARTKINPTYVNPLMKNWLQPSIIDARLIMEALISVKKKPKAEWSPLLRKLKEAEAQLKLMLQKEALAYQEFEEGEKILQQENIRIDPVTEAKPQIMMKELTTAERDSFLSASKQKQPRWLDSPFVAPERSPLYVTQQEYDESQLTGGENPKSSSGILTNVPDHDSVMHDKGFESDRFFRHLKQQSVRIACWGDDLTNATRKKLSNPTMVRCLKQIEMRKAQELSKQTEMLGASATRKKGSVVLEPVRGDSTIGEVPALQPTLQRAFLVNGKMVQSPMWIRRTNSLNGLTDIPQESTNSLIPNSPPLKRRLTNHYTKYSSVAGEFLSSRGESGPKALSIDIMPSPSRPQIAVVPQLLGAAAEETTGDSATTRMFPRIIHKSHQSLHATQDWWTTRTSRANLGQASPEKSHKREGSLRATLEGTKIALGKDGNDSSPRKFVMRPSQTRQLFDKMTNGLQQTEGQFTVREVQIHGVETNTPTKGFLSSKPSRITIQSKQLESVASGSKERSATGRVWVADLRINKFSLPV